MNEFIDECRREWRRLGVPDEYANEMAADLELDLHEAQADGLTTVEVFGPAALDPSSFAEEWASAQGVIPPASRNNVRWPRRWKQLRFGRLVPLAASVLAVSTGAAIATQRPSWRHFLGLPHLRFMGNAQAFAPGPPVDVPLLKIGTLVLLLGVIGLLANSAYLLWARAHRRTPA